MGKGIQVETDTVAEDTMGLLGDRKSPEEQLLAGVLLRAVRDLFSTNIEDHIWKRDALKWFNSKNEGPMSFKWVLKELELHIRPGKIDNMLLEAHGDPVKHCYLPPRGLGARRVKRGY